MEKFLWTEKCQATVPIKTKCNNYKEEDKDKDTRTKNDKDHLRNSKEWETMSWIKEQS